MLELLSLLANLVWFVGAIVAAGVLFFLGRVALRRLGGGGEWTAYTRPIIDRRGESVEVGIKRSRYLGLGSPQRMPLDTITTQLVSDDPANLYKLQARANETAESLNARSEQSDY